MKGELVLVSIPVTLSWLLSVVGLATMSFNIYRGKSLSEGAETTKISFLGAIAFALLAGVLKNLLLP